MAIIALVMLGLVYGHSIVVPFIIALLIWFVVKKTRNIIDKIRFIHTYIPTWFKTLLASIFVFGILFITGELLTYNIETLVASYTSYAADSEVLSIRINEMINMEENDQIQRYLESGDFTQYLQLFLKSISEILGNILLIVFYIIFLFIEEGLVAYKLQLFFKDDVDKLSSFQATMKKIDKMLSRYFILKSVINLTTSTIAFIIMWSIGLQSPFFWAALIFFLSFIPFVGPIVSTLLPAAFSIIQSGDFIMCWFILFGIGSVQVLVGNFVEPKIMGNTLNISPLVAIFSLALWGSLWGVVGMLLSVPITVAIIIVLAQFPSTRRAAILMSEKGKV
jgi:AI-2 transport protein TqsA